MRRLIFIGFLVLPTVAFAQVQAPPKEYEFKLNELDLQVISKGLQTQPFGEVAPVMKKMQDQFTAQQKPKEPAKIEKPVEKH